MIYIKYAKNNVQLSDILEAILDIRFCCTNTHNYTCTHTCIYTYVLISMLASSPEGERLPLTIIAHVQGREAVILMSSLLHYCTVVAALHLPFTLQLYRLRRCCVLQRRW